MAERLRFYVTEQLSANRTVTPEGFLLVTNCPMTRTGEFMYRDGEVPVTPDSSGNIRIIREAEDVFAEESIASWLGKPLTINHPGDFVSPENWQELAHGSVQNPRRGEGIDGDLLVVDVLVTTEEAIKQINDGMVELSGGYDAEYQEITPGVGKQTNIIGNHLAIVSKGRAGSRCRIGDGVAMCTNCGKCTGDCKDKKEEVVMKFKDKLMKWAASFPSRDEDEETEEQKAAREAKEKEDKEASESKDRKFKDEEEEADWEEFKKKKAEDRKAKDKKACDEASEEEIAAKKKEEEEAKDAEGNGLGELTARIEALETLINSLIESDEKVHEEIGDEDDPEKMAAKEAGEKLLKENEERKKKDESEDAEGDPEKEEEEEKEKATADAAFPEIAHRAEILFPGMAVRKPTKDHARALRAIKIGALKGASVRAETKAAVDTFTQGKDLAKLTNDALDAAFMGASQLLTAMNNSKVQARKIVPAGTRDGASTAAAVADIQARNKAYYKR